TVPTAGFLDPTFGSEAALPGRVVTDIGQGLFSAVSMVLQTDGKIVVAGGAINAGGVVNLALGRYKTDGSLDDAFGTGGKVLTDFGSSAIQSLVIQADGKIVAGGYASNGTNFEFALARYNLDGSLDDGGPADSTPGDSFGVAGEVLTDWGGSTAIKS